MRLNDEKRFSLPGLAVAISLGFFHCQSTQDSKCDTCAAAIAIKIRNQDDITSAVEVAGTIIGDSSTPAVAYDSSTRIHKIAGGPGKYLVSFKLNGSSIEFPDTITVEKIESNGCEVNNTVNLEVELGAGSIQIVSQEKSPRC